jgi:hypothetical protein
VSGVVIAAFFRKEIKDLLSGPMKHLKLRPLLNRSRGERGLSEHATSVLDYIDTSNSDSWIAAISALRYAMETERR